MHVRQITRALVWGRSFDRAQAFAERMSGSSPIQIEAVEQGEVAAAQADIICTVTAADTPILFGDWVRPGTHVNIVGSSYVGPCEIDTDLVVRSRYFADNRASVEAAGAEYIGARDSGLITNIHILGECGDVIIGRVDGRISTHDITVYKSLGHIIQDLAALKYLVDR